MTIKAAILAALALGASTSLAQAVPVAPTYDIAVWTGAPDGVVSTALADAAHKPTGLASAMFTYTGNIAFYSADQSTNTLGSFIGYGMGSVTNISSPRGIYATIADAMNAVLSTSGDGIDSYFQITTSYTSAIPLLATVTHDDGASLYVDGVAQFESAGETIAVPSIATLAAGTHTLTIDYVEANGAPSVLAVGVAPAPVPAPAMLSVLGASLLAAGSLARRR